MRVGRIAFTTSPFPSPPLQVTVQAGCRVQQLVEALKPHGLTLQVI